MNNKHLSHEIILSSLYLAPIQCYSYLFRAEKAVIDVHEHYQKQTYRNRCIIAGANGAMTLNIPIEKIVGGKAAMKDIRISDHGNWRRLHWQAIISAYNSTPFFEYYQDDFALLYEKNFRYLLDFNKALHTLICRLIGITTPITYSERYVSSSAENIIDYRTLIHPKRDWQNLPGDFSPTPYYQIFAKKYGFLPNLSIIDLLFNMGNEARLIL